MQRLWRAFHPDPGVVRGDQVTLSKDESHHIRRVLRLAAGDTIQVFDGGGGEWHATIVETDPAVTVEAGDRVDTEVESPLALILFQGLCRRDKMDWVVQKMTEIGAVSIRPLGCRNAERFPPDARRLERWRRIAVEACKQSGRRRVPAIELAPALPQALPGVPALLLDPGPEAEPLASQLPPQGARKVWVAAGPETGFTPGELAVAAGAGWRRVSLGPRILRTEGAGLVAAAVLFHALGDLGR
jgi:16S rRNA (uracil1498-N3)-methyltransferase